MTVGELVKSMSMLEVATVGELALLAKLADTLASMTEAAIGASVGLTKLTETRDIDAKSLQEWGQVAAEHAVARDDMSASLAGMAKEITKLQYNQPSSLRSLTDVMDISGIKDVPDFLHRLFLAKEQLGKTPGGISFRLDQAGIASFWTPILEAGEKAAAEAKRRAAVIGEHDIKTFDDIHKQQVMMNSEWTKLGNSIAIWTAPQLLKDFQALREIAVFIRESLSTGILGKISDGIMAFARKSVDVSFVPANTLVDQYNKMVEASAAVGKTPADREALRHPYYDSLSPYAVGYSSGRVASSSPANVVLNFFGKQDHAVVDKISQAAGEAADKVNQAHWNSVDQNQSAPRR